MKRKDKKSLALDFLGSNTNIFEQDANLTSSYAITDFSGNPSVIQPFSPIIPTGGAIYSYLQNGSGGDSDILYSSRDQEVLSRKVFTQSTLFFGTSKNDINGWITPYNYKKNGYDYKIIKLQSSYGFPVFIDRNGICMGSYDTVGKSCMETDIIGEKGLGSNVLPTAGAISNSILHNSFTVNGSWHFERGVNSWEYRFKNSDNSNDSKISGYIDNSAKSTTVSIYSAYTDSENPAYVDIKSYSSKDNNLKNSITLSVGDSQDFIVNNDSFHKEVIAKDNWNLLSGNAVWEYTKDLDSNVVHKTGTEEISGNKKFYDTIKFGLDTTHTKANTGYGNDDTTGRAWLWCRQSYKEEDGPLYYDSLLNPNKSKSNRLTEISLGCGGYQHVRGGSLQIWCQESTDESILDEEKGTRFSFSGLKGPTGGADWVAWLTDKSHSEDSINNGSKILVDGNAIYNYIEKKVEEKVNAILAQKGLI